jgi:hypothetical protein
MGFFLCFLNPVRPTPNLGVTMDRNPANPTPIQHARRYLDEQADTLVKVLKLEPREIAFLQAILDHGIALHRETRVYMSDRQIEQATSIDKSDMPFIRRSLKDKGLFGDGAPFQIIKGSMEKATEYVIQVPTAQTSPTVQRTEGKDENLPWEGWM